MRNSTFRKGFGILEVLIAAVVLGFLLIGLNLLQKGNREAVLRIRARDAAQIMAQNFIDSLSALGISSVPMGDMETTKDYIWKGKSGDITSTVPYTIRATISDEPDLQAEEKSSYAVANTHTPAKKVALTVSWQFKNATQSISEERILK